MSEIRAKVAYLQGLAEGLDIEVSSSEGRILTAMIDLLGDLAEEIETVSDAQAHLAEYVEDVDYDLGTLEESMDEEDDDEVTFVPDGVVLSEEDGIELASCPQCGEVLGATYGEFEHEHERDHSMD